MQDELFSQSLRPELTLENALVTQGLRVVSGQDTRRDGGGQGGYGRNSGKINKRTPLPRDAVAGLSFVRKRADRIYPIRNVYYMYIVWGSGNVRCMF